jgi:DNA-binding MarR family transcriptional regulator
MYDWNFDNPWIDTWWLLRQTRDALYRDLETALERREITIEQLDVMYFIAQYPDGVTVDELSIWCFRRKDSVLQLMKRMENKGLICRKKQPHQKRVFFHLTSDGKRELETYALIGSEGIKQLRQEFSEEDIQKLKDYLKRIRGIYLKRLGLQITTPRTIDKGLKRQRSIE